MSASYKLPTHAYIDISNLHFYQNDNGSLNLKFFWSPNYFQWIKGQTKSWLGHLERMEGYRMP